MVPHLSIYRALRALQFVARIIALAAPDLTWWMGAADLVITAIKQSNPGRPARSSRRLTAKSRGAAFRE